MRRRGLLYVLRPFHRLAHQLHRQPVTFLFWLTVGTLLAGALGLFLVEHNGTVRSFWQALFMAGASATTSETYDQVPHTGWGKAFTVLLGFAGITLSGCFVAAITSIIIQGPEPAYEQQEFDSVECRLERIERLLTKLERRTRRRDDKRPE